MSGSLAIIGLGPGSTNQITPEAGRAVSDAQFFYGYKPYVDRLALRSDQHAIASDNREELARAKEALEKAAAGHRVAVVSGGDPGVFAMAAAVCEAIESGPEEWRALDLTIVPGITAMLAVAARIGAPLGNDFCAVSLSDNLKPWEVIETRLHAAAAAGFVIALYNPISRARPWQLGRALERLRTVLPETTPVIFGRAASLSARPRPASSGAAESRRLSIRRDPTRGPADDRPHQAAPGPCGPTVRQAASGGVS